jgi:hypothetical protein
LNRNNFHGDASDENAGTCRKRLSTRRIRLHKLSDQHRP